MALGHPWLTIFIIATTLVGGSVQGTAAAAPGSYRIAVDADGNFHDTDDWAATPMTLALIARRGQQGRLVHYSYNNSIGASSLTMARQMRTSTLAAAGHFGFSRSRFYDVQTQLGAALANLRQQINRSTANDRLYVLAAGPMEFLWRAVVTSDPSRRRFVTVISHSSWNNNRLRPPQLVHDAADVRRLGVQWQAITDQNRRLSTRPNWQPWAWLRTARQVGVRVIHQRMQAARKPDVSDAGMAYFLLYRDAQGTPDKLRNALVNWN